MVRLWLTEGAPFRQAGIKFSNTSRYTFWSYFSISAHCVSLLPLVLLIVRERKTRLEFTKTLLLEKCASSSFLTKIKPHDAG